jgi:hypothetical protein
LVTVTGNTASLQFEGDEAARAQLLKRMIGTGFDVSEFQGKVESLEDAFMAITEGLTQ